MSSPVVHTMWQPGMAFSATLALSTMPASTMACDQVAGSTFTASTLAAWPERNSKTADGFCSANSLRTTVTPVMSLEPDSPANWSQTSVRSIGEVSEVFLVSATVLNGSGSTPTAVASWESTETISVGSLLNSSVTLSAMPACVSR